MNKHLLTAGALLLAGLACAAPSEDAPADAGAPDAGRVDAGPVGPWAACAACHGTPDSPAPPPDLSGSNDRTRPGVGAHAAHLRKSDWRNEVKCQHCHPLPAAGDTGHGKDVHAATVRLSGTAAAGVTASYDAGSCAAYCHGAKMRFGGPVRSPAWTSTAVPPCASCHGVPPPAPHPPADDCGRCHLDVADDEGRIVSASRHIDGYVMAPKGAHLLHLGGAGGTDHVCTTCHDGVRYHGALKDGQDLAGTTVCRPCHPGDDQINGRWRTWEPDR